MPEKISDETLRMLRSSQGKVQIAQLNYQAVLQEVAEFYKLVDGDNLNMETGEIARKVEPFKDGDGISSVR